MEMMLDKTQIQTIFLFAFKMGHEAARQLTPSTTCLSQKLLMNLQCSGGSGSFVKETSLEDEECSGQPPEVDKDQLRAIVKTDPLMITREVVEELSVDHSTVVWLLKQIGKMKKLNKVGTSWTDWKSKILSLSSVIFSNCTQQQQTISQWDCDVWWKVDCVWELGMTSSVAGLRRSSRALPKAIFWVMVTVW